MHIFQSILNEIPQNLRFRPLFSEAFLFVSRINISLSLNSAFGRIASDTEGAYKVRSTCALIL
jgi:hypothetical protein